MSKGKVIEIVSNPALKKDGSPIQGQGAKGAWSMSRVKAELDNGTTQEGNVFNPVSVGDEVEAEYNEQYSSWNFSKPKGQKPMGQMEQVVVNMLKEVVETQKKHSETLDAIHKAITGDEFTPDEFKTESMDEPIDLNEIPFS